MTNQFHVAYAASTKGGTWKLQQYLGTGTSSVVESNERWADKAEAEAVCERVNSGDKSGLTFAMYADD